MQKNKSEKAVLDYKEDQNDSLIKYRSSFIKISIAVLTGLIIAFLPGAEGLAPKAQNYLALLSTVILLWVLEAIPIGMTALVAAAGMILFGIQDASAAWAPYASPAVMFVMMIIMFGIAMNEVGIAKRLLYYVVKAAGTNFKRFSLFIAFISTFFSSVFHDATITIILIYAIMPIFKTMGISPKKSNKLSKFFMLLIPISASAGGFGTVLGGGRNPIALEILYQELGIKITFLDWILYQFPLIIISSVLTWVITFLLVRPDTKDLPESIRTEKMQPMSRSEKGISIIFILSFAAWTLSDFTGLHLSVVAAGSLIAMTIFRYLDFKVLIEKFHWEAWLVFGAGVSLGVAMLDSGAAAWLSGKFIPVLDGQSSYFQFATMGVFVSTISSFISNSAAVALSLPILLPAAETMGINPAYIALLLPAASSFIMLVIGCPPTIIAYSTGYFTQLDFIKVAVPLTIIIILILSGMMLLYWPMLG